MSNSNNYENTLKVILENSKIKIKNYISSQSYLIKSLILYINRFNTLIGNYFSEIGYNFYCEDKSKIDYDMNFNFLQNKRQRNITKIENNKKKEKIFLIRKVFDKSKEIEIKPSRKSKYRGVSKNGKFWQVLIMINRKKYYIGNFKTEEDAAKAYDEASMKYHKNKAILNFPHPGFISINH